MTKSAVAIMTDPEKFNSVSVRHCDWYSYSTLCPVTPEIKKGGTRRKGGGARVKGLLLFLWTVTEGGEVEIGKSQREREKREETMNDLQIFSL